MKAEELMIGDWVSYNGISNKISLADYGIDKGHAEWRNEIEPIPLTPEILEKNGWVSDNYNDPFRVYNLRHGNKLYSTIAIADDGKWSIEVNKEIAKKDKRGRADGVVFIRDWCNEFYVHELQHALRLCRIEKKIVI